MLILNGHRGAVIDLAFSPDSRLLVSTGNDDYLRLWDLSSGAELAPLREAQQQLSRPDEMLCFSPAGDWLAARSEAHGLQIWDVTTRTLARVLFQDCHRVYVRSLAVAPVGNLLVADEWAPAPYAHTLRRWNTSTWKEHRPLAPLLTPIPFNGLALDPTGKRVASGSGYVLDVQTGRQLSPMRGAGGPLLAWCPNRPLLAVGGDARIITIWQPDSSRYLTQVELPARHFQDFAFTPDGRLLITVSNEETAKSWDTTDWKERDVYAWDLGKLKCVTVAPDGMRAAAGSHHGQIVVWDLD